MTLNNAKRGDVIEALRPYVPTKYFHGLLECSTPFLKAILTFYECGGRESELDHYFTKPECHFGWDLGRPGGDRSVMVMVKHVIEEPIEDEKPDIVIQQKFHDTKRPTLQDVVDNETNHRMNFAFEPKKKQRFNTSSYFIGMFAGAILAAVVLIGLFYGGM